MHMTEYETTVVIRPDIGGDAVEVTLDKLRDVVKTKGGKLLAISHWGKKKLAYEIKKHTRGIYVHSHFLGGNQLVQELERNLRISDNVLRFMTIRMAEDVAVESREEKEYVKPAYDADNGNDDADDDLEFGADNDDDRGRGRDRDRDRGDRDDRDDRGRSSSRGPSRNDNDDAPRGDKEEA